VYDVLIENSFSVSYLLTYTQRHTFHVETNITVAIH